MKTRSGFVSNSSSSSFILKVGEPFDTVLDIAEYMIPKREWDADEALLDVVKKQRLLQNSEMFAVTFRSCNYNTFIAKMCGYFMIETCHNHDWDLSDVSVNCPPELEYHFGDDSFYEMPHKLNFYSLEYGRTGRVISWEEANVRGLKTTHCDVCFNEYWVIGPNVVCLHCSHMKGRQ